MSTLEERLAGGTSMPWIPDTIKADKYRAEGKDCYSEAVVIGVAVDHFTRRNFNDDGEYDVVVLRVDGVGEVAIHCGPTVLANQMHAARPRPGERVGVAYKGEREGARGVKYHDYVVKVDRELGGSFAWSDGGSAPSEPAPEPDPVSFPSEGAPLSTTPVRVDDDIPF